MSIPPAPALMYAATFVIATCFIVPSSFTTIRSASARVMLEAEVPPSIMLSSVAVAVTLVRSVGAIAILAEPSKETPAIVLAVVRVAALPVVF